MSQTTPRPGSPRWWRDRAHQDVRKDQGRGRPPMPIERVVTAAVELVDEVGPDEFSMRLLAQRLRSSTATLYRHFASKEEILVHVADHLLGDVPRHRIDLPSTSTWQERLTAGADALFRTLKEHPKAASLFAKHVPLGPHGLAGREATVGMLLSTGFTPETAARVYTAVGHYVVGFAVQLHTDSLADPDDNREILEFYRSLDPAHYPATVTSAPFLPSSLDDEFRFGLMLIIDGLSTHLARPVRQAR